MKDHPAIVILLAACVGATMSINFAVWRIVDYLPLLVQR
jgi:hypothetical protein